MFTSSALAMTLIPGILNAYDPPFMHTNRQKTVKPEEKQ